MRITATIVTLLAATAMVCFAADVTAGHSAFDKSCKSCHGADGTPNPAIAKMMKVDMKDLKSPDVQSMSNDDIKAVVTNGKGKMKPVKTVTGGGVDDVV